MQFSLENLEAEKVLQQIIHAAAEQSPVGRGLIIYLVDGLGWKYYNFLHVASSAWTGLALLAREQASANPYAPLETVKHP